jgi:oligopeptidase B
MGRQWYDDGKLMKKKNTFRDFISVTEHLVKSGYADPKRVYAMGGSAGGLLMGAVMNMRPRSVPRHGGAWCPLSTWSPRCSTTRFR